MTFIGRRNTFGVEYELALEQPDSGLGILGKLCFWVNDERFGDFDFAWQLSHLRVSISQMTEQRGKRTNDRLFELEKGTLFHLAEDGLCLDDGRSDEEVFRDKMFWIRLLGHPYGAGIFDNWYSIIVESGLHARYIWRDPNDVLHEGRFSAGEFDRVLADTQDALDAVFSAMEADKEKSGA